jgi:hypothetical protein
MSCKVGVKQRLDDILPFFVEGSKYQVGGGERGEESRKTLKSSPNARFFYSILPDFSCLFPFGVL